MTYQLVWTPDVARWAWNRNDYIHSLRPGTVWFPPDRCISREKARLQRSVLWEQQRGGDPQNFWCLSTNSSNDIQQSKLSAILEFLKGFSRLNHVETNFNHGTLFQNPNNRVFPRYRAPHLQNWNLWNLVIPNPINGSHMISPDCEVSQPFYD